MGLLDVDPAESEDLFAPSPWHSIALRWEPWRTRAALAVGVALAVVVAGVAMWRLASPERPPPVAVSLPMTDAPSPAVRSTTSALPPLVVQVAGAVALPGVYRLDPGARVADALAAAGGPLPAADVDQLNLASPLADGSRLWVPRPGQAPPSTVAIEVPPTGGGGGSATPTPGGKISINAAAADELEALPGVGPATAAAIVRYRTDHGPFTSIDGLLEVPGIGPAKLAAIAPEASL